MGMFDKYIKAEEEKLALDGLTYDEYEKNKIEWLRDNENNGYISDKTKKAYYHLLSSHIHNIEVAKRKDLNRFTSVEIESLIKSAITNSEQTKRSIYAAINNYLIYCTERGIISYNPCDGISKENLFEVNTKALKKQYMPLDEFYEFIDGLKDKFTPIEKMVLILVRYSVPVAEISNIMLDSLNEEDKTLDITIKNDFVSLPIDDEFIKRFKLTLASPERNGLPVQNLIVNRLGKPSTTVYIYKVLNIFREKRADIDTTMLFKNRRYDFALDIYKETGEITGKDLKNILDMLGLSSTPNRVTMFKSELNNIFELELEKGAKVSIDVIDVESGEVLGSYPSIKSLTEESKEKFGFYIDKSTVSRIAKGERKEFKGLTFIRK